MGNNLNKDQEKKSKYENRKYEVKGRLYHEKGRIRKRGKIVCIARHERKEYPHTDKQPPSVLGRFQEKNGDFTLHINHTGSYIEAVWAETAKKSWQFEYNKCIIFLWGRLEDDGSFRLTPNPGLDLSDKNDKKTDASLIYSFRLFGKRNNDQLKLKVWKAPNKEKDAKIYQLIPNESDESPKRNFRPTYMKEVLDTLPEKLKREFREVIKMYQWAPLTKQNYSWLVDRLLKKNIYFVYWKKDRDNIFKEKFDQSIKELIEVYFDSSMPKGGRGWERLKRKEAIWNLDFYIGYAVFPTQEPTPWHKDDLILAKFFAKLILEKEQIRIGKIDIRTYREWIQIMVDQYADDRSGKLDNLEKYLGFVPTRNKDTLPKYKYKVKMDFKGASFGFGPFFGVGAFAGPMTISQVDIKSDKVLWKKAYLGGLTVAGPGVGPGATYTPTAEAESHNNWKQSNFLGSFSILSIVGVGELVEIFGSEKFPKLQFKVKPGTGRSLSASVSYGTIESKSKYKRTPAKPPEKTGPYVVLYKNTDLVKFEQSEHFCLGSAKLTKAAISRIGFFCARELRSLMITKSRLWIVGHADRVDTEERNYELSELRAKNTRNVIEAILGNLLKANEVYDTGWGEEEAQEHDIKYGRDTDGIPNKKYRRVDVVLNARLVVRLYAE